MSLLHVWLLSSRLLISILSWPTCRRALSMRPAVVTRLLATLVSVVATAPLSISRTLTPPASSPSATFGLLFGCTLGTGARALLTLRTICALVLTIWTLRTLLTVRALRTLLTIGTLRALLALGPVAALLPLLPFARRPRLDRGFGPWQLARFASSAALVRPALALLGTLLIAVAIPAAAALAGLRVVAATAATIAVAPAAVGLRTTRFARLHLHRLGFFFRLAREPSEDLLED